MSIPWQSSYSRSRRKHAHRCFHCHKILTPGDDAIMFRINHGTKAVHSACANQQHGNGPETVREIMDIWSAERK